MGGGKGSCKGVGCGAMRDGEGECNHFQSCFTYSRGSWCRRIDDELEVERARE